MCRPCSMGRAMSSRVGRHRARSPQVAAAQLGLAMQLPRPHPGILPLPPPCLMTAFSHVLAASLSEELGTPGSSPPP